MNAATWFAEHYLASDEPPRYDEVLALLEHDDRGPNGLYRQCRELPVFQVWTAEAIRALAKTLLRLGSKKVLEVGAGDGRLTRWLAQELGNQVEIHASDSGEWNDGILRQPVTDILPLSYQEAIGHVLPDTVISSWMPFHENWTTAFLKASSVQSYILIGEESCCGNNCAWRTPRRWELEEIQEFRRWSLSMNDYWVPDHPSFGTGHSVAKAFRRLPL